MRLVALFINVVFLVWAIYMAIVDPPEAWILLLIALAPTSAILAIIRFKEETWIFLYFKRKRLEEKRKIETLNNLKGCPNDKVCE